jgi:phenylacetate-CoA ligase
MAGPLANRDVAAINAGLRGCRARALIGEPDRLARLGRLVLDGDVRLDVSPVAVFSQGMVMTHDMRATVASAFAAPIHERYAAFEFVPAVAYTCEHGWLHVNEHHFHVEIVSGARGAPHGAAARAGRVHVSDLTNYVAPMLRYEIGDLAEWAPDTACPCGRTWRRLARVIGRQAEVARTASGKEISQSGLARQLFLAVPELPDLVWEYQFQQRAPSEIVLCVVGRPGLGSSHLDAMTRALHEFFRGEVRFEVQVVDEIPVPMGGKRRLLVSSDDHGAWAPSANDFTDVEAPA